jgi:predicted permease
MARIRGVRRLFRLPSAERDVHGAVDDEIDFHVDMLTEQLVAAGRPPDEARREALQRFGNLDQVRRRCYDISISHESAMRRSELLSTVWQDVVYAARGLRRARGFSAVVLLTLALGIGATTAMFSVVRGVLLRPLPFPEPERVVRLWPANPGAEEDRGVVSMTELADWERDLKLFSAVGAFSSIGAGRVFGEGTEPVYAKTAYVSAGFFPALGTAARLGHALTPAEHVVGANRHVVVSHGFWQAQLGADPDVVGRTIRLSGEPFTVVGVMGPDFAYPSPEVMVWMPTSIMTEDDVGSGRFARWLNVVARLGPGVTPEQGRAEAAALQRRYASMYPQTNAGWDSATMESVEDSIVGRVRRGLLVLLGAVVLVLLVVCANVANLLLVRATGRGRELALRTALGARRGRVVRLMLTESVLLALVGGVLGVAVAWWGVRTLVALSASFLPRAADVRIDLGVLAFAVAVSVLTGLVFGLWPALRTSSTRLADALREGSRGSSGGAAANRARATLVAAEVALAVVLVAGAGLMLRSFQRLTGADPGFEPDRALLVRFQLEAEGPNLAFLADRRRVIERVRQVPGVTAAGATTFAPFTDGQGEPRAFTVPGHPAPAPGDEPRLVIQPASPGYLRALGIPLLAGQDIDVVAGDSTAPPAAIISRRMAERFWPGRSPVGESFMIMGRFPVRVIGVAGDVRHARLDSLAPFTAYVTERNMPRVHVSLVVRTDGDPARLVTPVRAAIREVLPRQAILQMVPMRDKLAEAASTPRFFTVLVTVFGAVALTLAAVGLYGVVSYVVRQREREIGVRVALGAPPGRVVGLMLRRGMIPVAAGLGVGLVAAVGATRLLRSMLYEVSATDPVTFAGVAALLAAVALLASWLPSRRAAGVNPTVTLRAE